MLQAWTWHQTQTLYNILWWLLIFCRNLQTCLWYLHFKDLLSFDPLAAGPQLHFEFPFHDFVAEPLMFSSISCHSIGPWTDTFNTFLCLNHSSSTDSVSSYTVFNLFLSRWVIIQVHYWSMFFLPAILLFTTDTGILNYSVTMCITCSTASTFIYIQTQQYVRNPQKVVITSSALHGQGLRIT
jgi:hypothetical protein